MRLSGIDVYSSIRIIQPNASDANQNSDFSFDLTKNAIIPDDFYELILYKMLNGYVTGEDSGAIHCGYKFVCYDKDDNQLFETNLVKIDRFLTENKTVFDVETELNLPDATVNVFISKVKILFVANNGTTTEVYTVLDSDAPAKCTFAEEIVSGETDKGVKIEGGADSKLIFNLNMQL